MIRGGRQNWLTLPNLHHEEAGGGQKKINGVFNLFKGALRSDTMASSTRNHSRVIRRPLKGRWRTFFLVQTNGSALSL